MKAQTALVAFVSLVAGMAAAPASAQMPARDIVEKVRVLSHDSRCSTEVAKLLTSLGISADTLADIDSTPNASARRPSTQLWIKRSDSPGRIVATFGADCQATQVYGRDGAALTMGEDVAARPE
ncbi:hypothetical protein [Inquilinus sp. Marseille-Q2685]|uniref:hypothetical protein n=1 Tax=Inquilinus sp. Marseille-Q2685 TaxID=2866581 RepID=UPI001CE4479F|nr:hypothetical protein [Inquilinus sp. Marseille-Q2685]